jgi:ketosteroid isomerase-like protein
MIKTNVEVVEAYYKAMNNKDRAGMAQCVHPDVHFLGPLAELTGRDIVLEAVERLFPLFEDIVIRAKLCSLMI